MENEYIPNPLLQYASLKKNCVAAGGLNRIEIWVASTCNEYVEASADSFAHIAKNLTDFDL